MLCAHPCTVVLQRAAGRHLISRGVLVPDALVAVQGCCTAPAQPPPDPRSPRPGAAGLVQDPVLHLGQLAALPHLRRRQHRGRRHRGALAGGGSPRGGPGGAVPLRRLRRSCPLPAVQRPRQAAGDAAGALRRGGQRGPTQPSLVAGKMHCWVCPYICRSNSSVPCGTITNSVLACSGPTASHCAAGRRGWRHGRRWTCWTTSGALLALLWYPC